jgi:NAD(P)-dependent dehydrogenase (short-subunit alcohol dehydrogenase family)
MSDEAVAVVTGGSMGLGRALGLALAERGWRLVIDGRRADRLDDAADEMRRAGSPEVVSLAGDVGDAAHRREVAAAVARIGRLDAFVNNASTLGVTPLPHLAEYPLAELSRAFEVNVVGPLALVQVLLPALRVGRGVIVNITSDAALGAYEGWGGYGATKAALEQLSNVLAAEEPEVRVHWVDPGDLRTEMHQAAFPGEDISDRPLPEVAVPGLLRLIEGRMPSGRYQAQQIEGGVR